MARFNTAVHPLRTVNLAGGPAYVQSPELALVSLLLGSFAKNDYYRSADQTLEALVQLLSRVDSKFAAKAALYARNEFGMRTVTHVIGAELVYANRHQHQWSVASFLKKLFRRPDDAMEVWAYYTTKYGKRPIPNSLKRGTSEALAEYSAYQIGKYKGEGREWNLRDLVNLTHPKRTEAINALMTTGISSDTWETGLTAAGQEGETEEEKTELKGNVWRQLLEGNRLGYFALLKNLRNIVKQAPDCLGLVCEKLIDRTAIQKSLVLPFRFMKAFEAVEAMEREESRALMIALSTAVDISLKNCPVFEGKTCIALDESASMGGDPIKIGSLFAAVLYKTNPNSRIISFSSAARYRPINPMDTTISIAKQLEKDMVAQGTDFDSIFRVLDVAYDRIIILSDMQAWMQPSTPAGKLSLYSQAIGKKPKVYSWDLKGYGSMQFPEKSVYALAGWSEKVFDLMAALELGEDTLLKRIHQVEI